MYGAINIKLKQKVGKKTKLGIYKALQFIKCYIT